MLFSGAGGERRTSRVRARFDALENRQLLSSVVYADGLAAYAANSPPPLPATAQAVAANADGYSYITGSFSGTAAFGNHAVSAGAAASNIFVARLDATGMVAWVDALGGQNPTVGDSGHGIALDASGNVYVTGWFSGPASFGPFTLEGDGGRDVFVAKLDSAGDVLWAESFGGTSDDLGQALALDSAGNIYVGGSFQDVFTVGSSVLVAPGGGVSNGFVMKLDSSGRPLWAMPVAGAKSETVVGVAADAAGNVYSTGAMGDDSTSTGMPTTFCATISLPSLGMADAFVMKQDTNGSLLWVDQFGGPGRDVGTAVALDPTSGDLYATGGFSDVGVFGGATLTSQGLSDIYLARIDPLGNVRWAKSVGGNSQDGALALAVTTAGNVYDAGYFMNSINFQNLSLTTSGSFDAFLAEFDPLGNVLSAQDLGGPGGDIAQGVAISGPAGNVTVVGIHSGPLSVASISLPATSNTFAIQLCQATALPKPVGDFLNLGKSQLGFYSPTTSDWTVQTSTGDTVDLGVWGAPNFGTIPLAADFNGVGSALPSYFDPSSASWWTSQNGVATKIATFGLPNLADFPVPADYDGVGKSEIATFRPSTAQWIIMRPDGGQSLATFGGPNLLDIPAPADYDGLGRAQIAVYRPTTAQWFVLQPNGGRLLTSFGWPGASLNDIPIPGDYDGVGHAEVAVFRPSTGQVFVRGPQGSYVLTTIPAAMNLAEVPLLASSAALIRLGKVYTTNTISAFAHSQKTHSNSASETVSVAPSTIASSAPNTKSPQGTTSHHTTTPIAARSAVVVNQGTMKSPSGKDAIATALDRHYGSNWLM